MSETDRRDRLQKALARAGVGSRRHIEELIREGKVTVNGRVAELGERADLAEDSVKVEGRRIHYHPPAEHHLLLHKPSAVMSTVSDPEGRPTVMELIPPALHKGLVPVGRLDFMTTGLILLTTDGDLAHRVAHPRYGCKKTYEVKVKGHPDEVALRRLRTGILLEGRKTAPAEVESRSLPRGVGSADNSWWTVRLGEGRTRQIREMFQRVGHPVQKLRRVAIGPVRDEHLLPGQYRELTEEEVEALRSGADELASEAKRRRAVEARKPRGARSEPADGSAPRRRGASGAKPGSRAEDARGADKGRGARPGSERKSSGPAKRQGPGSRPGTTRTDGPSGKPRGGGAGPGRGRSAGSRSGTAGPGSGRPGGARPGGGRSEGVRSGASRPGGGRSEGVRSGGNRPGGDRPGGNRSGGGR
ncbi:MAG: pseudouridine synthase, partial [Acidobacteria bacterium]|nr:pseudouridine synthase [Acidobacteriota bacterium]